MSKITIVSRPDQHLLIDISGCSSFKEAIEQLSAALLSANQFWQGTSVDLNLGLLLLTKSELGQIVALTKGVGISAKHILAENPDTANALKDLAAMFEIAIAEESRQISSVAVLTDDSQAASQENVALAQPIIFDGNDITSLTENVSNREMITSADSSITAIEPSVQKLDAFISDEKKDGAQRQSLYIKQTLRAGQAVSHKGDLIIVGDVNAGAEVLAEGDIIIWGSLRGIAHAGVGGNTTAEIRALRLQPIQLRIAHYIARSPDALSSTSSILSASPFIAETAKLVNGKIRILRETFD